MAPNSALLTDANSPRFSCYKALKEEHELLKKAIVASPDAR